MKLKKVILGLSLSGVALAGFAGVALGADTGGIAETTGTIDFITEENPTGNIIKPDTDDIIETDDGNSTTGNLRLQFVPNFNFGRREIKTGKQEFSPSFIKYTYKEVEAGSGREGEKYLPQFIQVTDTRGNNQGFILSVKATTFKRAGTGDELPNATIKLNEGLLFNTVHSNQEIANRVSTFKGANNTDALIIPTAENTTAEVMRTRSNNVEHTTNGTQTSLVLANDYDKNDLSSPATTENKGVVFTKTNQDIPTVVAADPYVSTITWILSDAL